LENKLQQISDVKKIDFYFGKYFDDLEVGTDKF